MNISLILFGILPLFAFVLIDSFLGLKAGLVSAIILAAAEALYTLITYGSLDELSIASLVLVLVFGGISLKSNKAIYMKLQPVFLGLCFGAVLLVMQAMGKPLLLMFIDKYDMLMPENFQRQLQQPFMREQISQLSLVLGVGFLCHAGAVAYAAFRMSNWWWLLIRGVGLYVMMFGAVIVARLIS